MDLTQTKLNQLHKLGVGCFLAPSSPLTHHHDDEVQPAPGVGEVLDEAQGEPLDHHLHGEDDSEDPVHVVEDVLEDRPLSQVDVLRSLKETERLREAEWEEWRLTRARLLMRIMAMTAVSKYLFSIRRNVLILRLAQPCQNGESSSPARQGKLR